MDSDTRWKQRFQNFGKVLHNLENALSLTSPDFIQQAGLIHLFEVSFEVSWKLMKDYLEGQGFTEIRSPRDSIKKAFEVGLITDGHAWLEALNNQNLTAHTYDETVAAQVVAKIRQAYYPLLKQLFIKLKDKI